MRLWHEKLIKRLPRQQLLGQHRECCALRGNGWGKPHATVNYVFSHSPFKLFAYHQIIMNEMSARGYRVNELWLNPTYRGASCEPYRQEFYYDNHKEMNQEVIYSEHDNAYLEECLNNLKEKGILINLNHD
ncbi:TIGR02328 family protein [Aquibacillus saliphilus]|uniref:TIGR02328 family protein n=1 Tax=Aquibacillus saliphilus TaxID=1909422 RepID=UPI001CF07422|nr:TIGR02328 family protein [Aquibacillus saliphilus]